MTKKSATKPRGATSYRETAFGIISRSKLLPLELEGTKKGLEFIQKILISNKQIAITPELILTIHNESFGWIFPKWAGKYRTTQVEFSGKEAVLFILIPEMITNLCADLEERIKHLSSGAINYIEQVVELLAWFQHEFVLIHPFQDYNGRLARMLTTLILLKISLPPIELKITGNGRRNYLEAMYAADGGDFTKLEQIIGNALNESLRKVNV